MQVEQAGMALWGLWEWHRTKIQVDEGQGGDTGLWGAVVEHLDLRCNQARTIKGGCVHI